jgi:hypothetical protein
MKKLYVFGVLLLVLLLVNAVAAAGELPLVNGGFEELADGVTESAAIGKTPYMWAPTGKLTEDGLPAGWEAVLTNEKVFSGKFAAKIVDPFKNQSVILLSKAIKAEVGKEYTATAKIFHVDDKAFPNKVTLYIEFWSAEPPWDPDVYSSWDPELRTGFIQVVPEKVGEWETVVAKMVAPENTAYVTVSLYAPYSWAAKAYVDDVTLSVAD